VGIAGTIITPDLNRLCRHNVNPSCPKTFCVDSTTCAVEPSEMFHC